MKKLLFVMLLAVSLTGCGMMSKADGTKTDGTKVTEDTNSKPKVGETAVRKFSPQGYVEGKVEKIEGSRYEVRYGTTIDKVDAVDVYALPKQGAKVDVKAGDVVVAYERESYWPGCTVKSVSDDIVEVEIIDSKRTMSVPHEKVIKISPAGAAEFKKYGEKKAFEDMAKSKKPTVPAGYKPKVGEKVLAKWSTSSWYPGVVKSLTANDATVDWPSFSDSTVAFESILPFPKTGSATGSPKAGDFVLVRPASDTSGWDYAQVTSVNGQDVEVKFSDGKTATAKAGDYVPLS